MINVVDPQGRVRSVRVAMNGFYYMAYIRTGLFKREYYYSSGEVGAIEGLIKRLKQSGWKVVE